MKIDPRCKRLNELNDRYHQLLRQVAEGLLKRHCRESSYPEELCMGDYMLLYQVGEGGEQPVHMAEISRRLSINPSTATRRVNRLLADGLVTKAITPDDDRCFDLRVTVSGRMLLDIMEDQLYDAIQKTYENVTEEELQTVYGFLDKCNSVLGRLAASEKHEQ